MLLGSTRIPARDGDGVDGAWIRLDEPATTGDQAILEVTSDAGDLLLDFYAEPPTLDDFASGGASASSLSQCRDEPGRIDRCVVPPGTRWVAIASDYQPAAAITYDLVYRY